MMESGPRLLFNMSAEEILQQDVRKLIFAYIFPIYSVDMYLEHIVLKQDFIPSGVDIPYFALFIFHYYSLLSKQVLFYIICWQTGISYYRGRQFICISTIVKIVLIHKLNRHVFTVKLWILYKITNTFWLLANFQDLKSMLIGKDIIEFFELFSKKYFFSKCGSSIDIANCLLRRWFF